jgi:hypothetical protein
VAKVGAYLRSTSGPDTRRAPFVYPADRSAVIWRLVGVELLLRVGVVQRADEIAEFVEDSFEVESTRYPRGRDSSPENAMLYPAAC